MKKILILLSLEEEWYGWTAVIQKNLLEASNLIASIQFRQKFKVGCIEEIAISNGWISKRSVLDFLDEYPEEVLNYIKNLP